ncbi:MAG: alpha/beta fold hydrolase [Microthrixaceae bacterium]
MGKLPPIRFATTADGVRIAYCIHGEGPPLVYVRGWVSHLELTWEEPAYQAFFDQLARHLQVVRFDARANGLSDRTLDRLDLDGLTADVEAVMDELGLGEAILWGSAFGGPVAITYAARHPERVSKLILDGAYATMKDQGTAEARESFQAMLLAMRGQPDAVNASFLYMHDPDDSASVGKRVELTRRSISPQALAHLYQLAIDYDVSDLLPTLTAPTLVLHRRRNRAFPIMLGRTLASLIPGAQFVAIEGGASNLWREQPDDALAAIGGFLGLDIPRADEHPPEVTSAWANQSHGDGATRPLATDVVSPVQPVPEPWALQPDGPPRVHQNGSAPIFRLEGEYWTIAFDGTTFRMRNIRGLQLIARLLAAPGRELHALDLDGGTESAGGVSRASAAQAGLVGTADGALPALDTAAKAAYKQRLGDLAEELEEAQHFNDPERAARAQAEIDALVQALTEAVGLGGRDRPTGSATERARVNVTRSIKTAIRRIEDLNLPLGLHLGASIRTGTFCSYTPDPRAPIEWQL